MKFSIGPSHFIFLFSFLSYLCQAQTESVTEMISRLEQVSSDSARLTLYYQIATQSRNVNPQTHKAYSLQGLALAQTLNTGKTELRFLRELGIYYKKKGDLDSATLLYRQTKEKALALQDSIVYYETNISLANVAKSQGDYKEAVDLFLKTIRYFETHPSKGSDKITQLTKFNLSSVYLTIANYGKAIDQLKTLKDNGLVQNNPRLLRAVYNNLMAAYIKTEVLDSALFYGKKAQWLAEESKSTRSMANIDTNLGAILEKQRKYPEAQAYFQKALTKFEILGDERGIAKSLNNLGNIYTRQRQYTKGEASLLKAQLIIEKSAEIYSLKHNYEMLISLYSAQNKHFKAFEMQQQLMLLKDSILGIEQQQGIEKLQTEYETDKKELLLKQATQEKTLAELSASKDRSRLIQGSTLGGTALLSLCFYLVLFRSKKQKQILSLELNYTRKQRQLETDYNGAELKALKAQMNPHFLFNAMNSVQGLILDDKKKEACLYLARLSALVRKNLELSATQYVAAAEEMELLETYLKLEQMRFGKSLQYRIEGLPALEGLRIPAMIIQPFLENAIKHGLLHKTGLKWLTLHFELGEVLTCTITDNGVGRTKARTIQKQQKGHSSFSTQAIAKRFELLQPDVQNHVGFETLDLVAKGEPAGTRVILKMPFKSSTDE